MAPLKLVVLVSGRGSNLQSLIDACQNPDFPARVVCVVSNRPDAFALTRATKAGIPTVTIDHKDFSSRDEFECALNRSVSHAAPDLICLAGFMRVLSPGFVAGWEGRILNIHPSLLPEFPGLDTHNRVLSGGRSESGCTVHQVTAELDAGPIILQRRVPVMPDDSADTLAARVLAAEHIAYPDAVRLFAERILNQKPVETMIPS